LNKRTIIFTQLFSLIVVLLFANIGNAQNRVIDSLKGVLSYTKDLDSEIRLLVGIGTNYSEINLDSAHLYLMKAENKLGESSNSFLSGEYHQAYGIYLRQAGKLNEAIIQFKYSINLYKEVDSLSGIQLAYNFIGTCFYELNLYDSAIYYHQLVTQMIDISSSSKDKLSMLGANFNNLANVYSELNENKKALNYYLRALTIFEKIKQYQNAAIALDNIGQINLDIKNFEKAITFFNKAININQKNGNVLNLCSNYNNLGLAYKRLDDYDSSIYYYTKAVNLSEESGFTVKIAQSNHNLGSFYIVINKYDLALKHLEKSLIICKELEHVPGEILNLLSIGRAYAKLRQFKSAETYLLEALKLEQSYNRIDVIANIYEELSLIYEESGKFKKAVEYYKLTEAVKDSLYDIENFQLLNELQAKYDLEQKDLENLQLKKQNEINELIITRQKLVMIASSFIVVLLLVIFIIFIVNRVNRKKQLILLQKKNKTIEEKSLELKKSNYTKDKLFTIIAHDLRSPFNSLLGFSSLLDQEVESGNYEDLPNYTKQLLNSSEKAYDLVDNLLNWAKSQQDNIEIKLISVSLTDMINEATDVLISMAKAKQIKIVKTIVPDTMVYTDSNMMLVILRNLINNAIKYSFKGGKIEIGCIDKTNHFVISVKDNGIGIDSDLKDNLIKNNIGHTTLGTENESGSGLGLLLIKDFVKRLGGEVWIESIPEKGSTFSFTIQKSNTSHIS